MIIQTDSNITSDQQKKITQHLERIGYSWSTVTTQFRQYIIAVGNRPFDIRRVGQLSGVTDVHRVSDPYKLVSKKWKLDYSDINIGDDLVIGPDTFTMMAGPCSIESEAQIESTVDHLVKNNIPVMRGGVYKPRSSPYSFRGLGMDGLKLFAQYCRERGIKIITEVMMVEQVEEMHDYVDIFQVGARNSQNFNLLDVLGGVDKPVLLKRGMSMTIPELLQSAEYIFSNGNEKIILCERGIRTFENSYRNTMDINAIAILKERSHLPVIADPSHGVGIRKYVDKVAKSAVMAGADGVIMEVHEVPQQAFSDGQQTLDYVQAEQLYKQLRELYQLRESFDRA
ncbi:3-deoxy-7-phosphoheptulonate synthase [Membranicola marinus]|uniref:3-deoxy-7-phosphoheptulonate synthase n=1 Tax=Membranihabitans marinus TaxID=1227546 RepID=A0A953HV20_9BACT|nr:3-deoxy-7-phosphoheptulonate synthase [Membranihabitans marinus]MBY5958810.1 3-deoxy-7-phosphoheptulonate synthase [Membranihabitans marinus]